VLPHQPVLLQQEMEVYVVSTGGDVPRWRPAQPHHMLRVSAQEAATAAAAAEVGDRAIDLQGATDADGVSAASEQQPVEQPQLPATTAPDLQSHLHVEFLAERLWCGQQAEAQLARFARKLVGRGAAVVMGAMSVQLCSSEAAS
jgi:hypothetical protein